MVGKAEIDQGPALRTLTAEELVRKLQLLSPQESSPYCQEIIRRFEPLLRRAWRHILVTHIEYEDFVQEVIVKLFKRLRELTPQNAFPGYFRSIVYSVASDALRKSNRQVRVEGMDENALESKVQLQSKIDDIILTGVVISSFLEKLPPSEQAVLSLEFVHGLSPPEIMRMTGLTRGGISSTKSRAIKRLQEILAKENLLLEKISKLPEEK